MPDPVSLTEAFEEPTGWSVKREDHMPKVVQTAGRDQLGEFAPMFAELNDDVLFGEVWSDDTLTLKMVYHVMDMVFIKAF